MKYICPTYEFCPISCHHKEKHSRKKDCKGICGWTKKDIECVPFDNRPNYIKKKSMFDDIEELMKG